ncbi:phosphatidic acid-binding protein, partial [Pseudomonas aeruginosa]|nr:phosphatidic acid-binding protein [Pseudomonas aeruginosa]
DTELGLAVKNLLDSLDPEHLPPWLWNAVERAGRAVQEERGEAPQGPVQGARGG